MAANDEAAVIGGKIQVTIEYDQEKGGVSITGPLEHRVLMLGILEEAKVAVVAFTEEKKARDRVRAAHGGIVPVGALPHGLPKPPGS